MTQIQTISAKEMTRRTGVNNALGYSYPKKDLILLKKGLTGKKKREVLDHEINHLAKGEEGPFLSSLISSGAGLVGSYMGGKSQQKAADAAAAAQREQSALARADLSPYREFGAEQMGEMQNWLATPEGQFTAPTMEEVQATPGYATRMGAVESSAAARGGLFSGNALRDIGEFGASEYDRAYGRRQTEYQNELNKRMGFANIGYGAAGGSAGISQDLGSRLAQIETGRGASKAGMYGDMGSTIAGGIGAYQGQQNWNSLLDRFGGNKSQPQDQAFDDTDWGDYGSSEDDYGELGW
jgi:hypothetical protein